VVWSGAGEGPSSVWWGSDAGNLKSTAAAAARSYRITDMCAAPANSTAAWSDPGNIYDAVISTSTSTSTIIFYQYGNSTVRSPIRSFSVGLKSVGDPHRRTKFLAFGDMGTPAEGFASAANSTKLLEARVAAADFVLHVGDISYAVGKGKVWDAWGEQVAAVATSAPYHVCMGNHEYDFLQQPFRPELFTYKSDSGGECGVPYNARFHMPGPLLVAGPGDYVAVGEGAGAGAVQFPLPNTAVRYATRSLLLRLSAGWHLSVLLSLSLSLSLSLPPFLPWCLGRCRIGSDAHTH
jgi:hypothetical protein